MYKHARGGKKDLGPTDPNEVRRPAMTGDPAEALYLHHRYLYKRFGIPMPKDPLDEEIPF